MVVFVVFIVVTSYNILNHGNINMICLIKRRHSFFVFRDCPFEEHATFYPLCDFIQKVRGLDYVNRIILECGRSK